jgi:hypothetical protein
VTDLSSDALIPATPFGIAEHGTPFAELARSRFFQSDLRNLPIGFFWFFWNFFGSRKATGTDDFAFAFGFTGLKKWPASQIKQLDRR